MAIQTGQQIVASDFKDTSAGAGDAGKGVKLGSDGKINKSMIKTKFGGTGADGALSVSSGNTNIDLGGVQYFEKNYSSISITGTGSITFINPHAKGTVIVLRCSGDVVLTSSATPMINASGCGASGASGVTRSASGSQTGGNGSDGTNFNYLLTKGAVYQTAGAIATLALQATIPSWIALIAKYPRLFVGGGGGSGGIYNNDAGTGNTTSGAGGRGGGCLIIECAGSWNFTTTNGISVAGQNGGAGTMGAGVADGGTGGGGGGGGGLFIGLYNVLVANSGTVNVAGGVGAVGVLIGTVNTNQNGAGGGGSATNAGVNGTNYSGTTPNTKTGGDGGAGLSFVGLNNEFF